MWGHLMQGTGDVCLEICGGVEEGPNPISNKIEGNLGNALNPFR